MRATVRRGVFERPTFLPLAFIPFVTRSQITVNSTAPQGNLTLFTNAYETLQEEKLDALETLQAAA